MKRIHRIIPLVTVILGLAAAIARQQLFLKADWEGLLPRGGVENLLLFLLPLSLAVGLGVYCFFAPQKDFRSVTAFPIRAIGHFLLGAALGYMALEQQSTRLDLILFGIAAVMALSIALFQAQRKRVPLLLPALLSLAVLVISIFRTRALNSSTQLAVYLFPALSFLFLALYTVQSVRLQIHYRVFNTAFACNQLALFFTLVSLSSQPWLFCGPVCLYLLGELFVTPCRMVLPKGATECIDALEDAGHTAYAVGGCVRDSMLGNTPHDYDLCTSATPQEICEIFSHCKLVRNGEKHGTVGVVTEDGLYEITTYRTEGGYQDNRHPDWVEFVKDIDEDLKRRDFTVNAMAFHPKTGYYDPLGGQQDLFGGVLRAVGDPQQRFREDALRILRGIRFACRFHLQVEPETMVAMNQLSPLMSSLASERILAELNRILCYMDETDLLLYQTPLMTVIPELAPCKDFDQKNPHHKLDLLSHIGLTLACTKPIPSLRWAALLHDIGKPQVFTTDEQGVGHFHGHAAVSAELAEGILTRLKAPNALKEQVVLLVAHHMDPLEPTPSHIRKKISRYGAKTTELLIKLQEADRRACGVTEDRATKKLLALTQQLEQEEGRLQIRDLACSGHDLMDIGFEAGPAIGNCQKELLEQVLSGTIPNEKEALLASAREILTSKEISE